MSEHWQQAVEWIEAELEGKVVNVKGQGRWRSAWFFDLEKDGEMLPMYFRGHRPGLGKDSKRLLMEMQVMQVLEKHGVPVPHIYGLCPGSDEPGKERPEGIVMENKPGQPVLSNLQSDNSHEDQLKVLGEYVDALVAMHSIDISEFDGIELTKPGTSDERGLADIAYWEGLYRKQKYRPEPLIEFVTLWLKNNIPENRDKTVFLHVDSGQFIYDGNNLSALLDFELSMLGDPMADLAGLRTRHLSEPLVELSYAYKRYEELTGEPIDWYALDYHTVRFALMTPMPIAALVAFAPPRVNLPQYQGWYHLYSLIPIEIIARLEKVDLKEPVLPEIPDDKGGLAPVSEFSPTYKALFQHLSALHGESSDPDLQYELDITQRIAEYLQRVDAIGREIDKANQKDLEVILGEEIISWQDAQQKLEELVLGQWQERKAELINYFYRYSKRHLHLLGPALRELYGAKLELGTF